MKKVIALIISISICFTGIPFDVLAVSEADTNDYTVGEIGGYLISNFTTVSQLEVERLFSSPTGHGFAAEQGNNLIDKLHGLNATVVGGDNAANGPDRKIVNRDGTITWIQDKYYSSGSESVRAAFDPETGLYRYIDADGKPMKLEVPADQFDDAVNSMKKRIEDGKVPGVSDPDEASNIVKKGRLTYKQAKNIAKAGTVESLAYDAVNGVIIAACAFGISFLLDYAMYRMDGCDNATALKKAGMDGLKTGGVVFASYVIAAQIGKTGAASVLAPTSEAIAKTLGSNIQRAILDTFGVTPPAATTASITNQVAKVIADVAIADAVVLVVLSVDDIYDVFSGRISKEQFVKNIIVTIASIAGATVGSVAGAAVGTAILPGAGTAVGKVVGGIGGGYVGAKVSDTLLSKWYEGDAEEMYEVLSDEFTEMCIDYIVNEDEAADIIDTINTKLTNSQLKKMYASEDRTKFAHELMAPIFDEKASQRSIIVMPNEIELRYEMLDELQGIVFLH